jgi:hypothetical protein
VLGDPAFHLSFRAFERLDTNVGMWMSVKVPVASSAEFGTGEWDLGGGLSMLCIVGTRWLGALDLSYWHLGDTPALDFHDPVGSIASVTRFAGDWAIAASASVSSATIAGYDPAVAVGAGITRRVGTGSWTTHLSFGVTDTAAQLVAAVLWRVPLLTQRHGRIQ